MGRDLSMAGEVVRRCTPGIRTLAVSSGAHALKHKATGLARKDLQFLKVVGNVSLRFKAERVMGAILYHLMSMRLKAAVSQRSKTFLVSNVPKSVLNGG